MKKGKGWLWTLYILFALLNVLDVITALMAYSEYESNPLVRKFGWTIAILFKLGIVALIGYYVHKFKFRTKNAHFILVHALVLAIPLTAIGVWTNIYAYQTASSIGVTMVEQYPTLQDNVVNNLYWVFSIMVYLYPLTMGIISHFILNKTDCKIISDAEYQRIKDKAWMEVKHWLRL